MGLFATRIRGSSGSNGSRVLAPRDLRLSEPRDVAAARPAASTSPISQSPAVACQLEKSVVIGARSRTKCVHSAATAASRPARRITAMKMR